MMFLKKEAPNFFIFLRLDNDNGDGQNGHNMVHIKNTPKIIFYTQCERCEQCLLVF